MAEEMDTLQAPGDGSADSAGHAPEAQETSQAVSEQTSQEETQTSQVDSTAPTGQEEKPSYKYLGKKYADISQMEAAMDEANRKIQETGTEKNLLREKAELLDRLLAGQTEETSVGESVQTSPELQRIEKEVTNLRLRQAQMEESKILDSIIQDRPHLASVREHIVAGWRSQPQKKLEDIIAPLEKLVSVGRNENRTDMLKKKEQAVVSGTKSTESASTKPDKFAKAMESGKLADFAEALPDEFGLNR